MPIWLFILALFVMGFILILIEMIIIPGFGFAGVLGTVSLAVACITAFKSLSTTAGILVTIASIAVTILMFKILPKTALWKKVRLSSTQKKSDGYQVADPAFKALVGKTGTSLTVLRPSGTVSIEDKRYDVVADGDFIESDRNIEVYEVEGNKIVVREIKENS